MSKKNIFIAIDTNKVSVAKKIIKQTQINKINTITLGYKFGLEFILSKNGRNFISKLKNEIIFVDTKLSDIPNTMKSAVNALKDLKINYLTVHISSGLEALRAVKKISGKIKIVGVSTLTSLNNKNLKEIGYSKSVKKLVIHQARLAKKLKLDALVCGPNEVKYVRKIFNKEIITPGVRFNRNVHDQKRTMHPSKINSDWLVCGRIITKGNIKNNLKKLIQYLK